MNDDASRFFRYVLPAAVAALLPLGGGCAGTSPQLNAPQIAAPNSGTGSSRSAGTSTGADEAALAPLEAVKTPEGSFLAAPYLQLGANGRAPGKTDTLTLVWLADDDPKTTKPSVVPVQWTVETRPAGKGDWKKASAPTARRVVVGNAEGKDAPPISPHKVWTAPLANLTPGALFDYRVLRDGKPVFSARARARRPTTNTVSQRFVIFGDVGAGNEAEKKIAYQISLARPDYIFITGDIVYPRGTASEYRKNFFPILNADTASAEIGAPLMRSTLFLAAPGNHDLGYRDFIKYPDALAYYYYWHQPMNGPLVKPGMDNTPRLPDDPKAATTAFLAGAGAAYPRAANFSFDSGGIHWAVLDSNSYVDWTDPALRAWLEKDLASAKNAAWRFVAFHHPPFHTSSEHQNEQRMRVLCDLFEKHKVDVVWAGHVHNYQRTYPLTFVAKKQDNGKWYGEKGQVEGAWTLDKTYDGDKQTKPKGVLYITTGGGGASLYSKDLDEKRSEWKPFMAQYIAAQNSFTQVDVTGNTLTARQIGADGKEVDKFVVTK